MFGFKKKGAKNCSRNVEAGADMCSNSKNSASTKNCSRPSKVKK